jgi:phosphoribosylanthranilate isomerase
MTGAGSLQKRPGAARLLLDGPAGGSGKSFAWSLAAEARKLHQGELFISGGLTPENVAQAIAQARPDGVDVASGIEGPDGFKDPARVRAFVRAVRGTSR